jgi:hypothetical protein
MNKQHTPGPWSMRESATHVTVTNASGDAVFHDDKRIPGVLADARLIVATPELLEACKAALSDDQSYIEKCRAAITKATGEQP